MGILALDCLDWRSNLPHYLNAWRLAMSREVENWCRTCTKHNDLDPVFLRFFVGTHCHCNLVIVIYTCMFNCPIYNTTS